MSVIVKNLLFKKRQDTCLSANTVLRFSKNFIAISFAWSTLFKGWKKSVNTYRLLERQCESQRYTSQECLCLFCFICVNLLLNYLQMSFSVLFLLTSSTAKKWSFPFKISLAMCPNQQKTSNMVTFAEEIFNGKVFFA